MFVFENKLAILSIQQLKYMDNNTDCTNKINIYWVCINVMRCDILSIK